MRIWIMVGMRGGCVHVAHMSSGAAGVERVVASDSVRAECDRGDTAATPRRVSATNCAWLVVPVLAGGPR